MKISLIYPPYSPVLGNHRENFLPLGLPYLSAYLKREGHEVSLIDLNIKMYSEVKKEYRKLWQEKKGNFWRSKKLFFGGVLPKLQDIQEKWIDTILKSNPGIIGFYVSYTSKWMAPSLAKRFKEKNKDIAIIFGGPECYPENTRQFFEMGHVDAVVTGEGEITLSEIVNSYEKTGQITPFPGAFCMVDGAIVYGGQRGLIKDLDTLPYPDFSDLIDGYKAIFGAKTGLSCSLVRGCTHKCAFCYESRFWRECRSRSPQSFVNELINQTKKYGIKIFFKTDSILSISEELLVRVCDLLIEADLGLTWCSQARAEKYLSLSLLEKMYKAGCRRLCYGVESGSQPVIDRMNKGLDLKIEQEVIIKTYKAEIKPIISIMVGQPGEAIIDFIKSIYFVLKNRKFIYKLNVSEAVIAPMSDWCLQAEKFGIIIYKHFWRSKYFINNRYTRKIKKYIMGFIYKLLTQNKN